MPLYYLWYEIFWCKQGEPRKAVFQITLSFLPRGGNDSSILIERETYPTLSLFIIIIKSLASVSLLSPLILPFPFSQPLKPSSSSSSPQSSDLL
ncbi:hypothetical protein RIF29_42427 [Crotalaria pallida]|uniref:Uncharacterized protein n=1 Tax=Crotalaria pallida TaxID=3830 RepID=A0AAN9E940_CROPI